MLILFPTSLMLIQNMRLIPSVITTGLIFFSSQRSHAIPLFIASNILPINMLYFEAVSTIMYDVSIRSTPQNIRELFIHSSDVHVCNTRFSCTDNLFVQKSRLHMKLKSFPAFGTRLWNCLLPDWRKLTKRAFKKFISHF